MPLANLKKYWLVRVLGKWVWLFGLLPLFLDIVTTYIPRQRVPKFILVLVEEGIHWEVTIILVSLGLLLSAYLVHRETQIQLSNLVSNQANLRLECTKLVFLHNAPHPTFDGKFGDGLRPNGLPVEAIVSAQIEVHNLGREDGQLDWDLDFDQLVLSKVFVLSSSSPRGSFNKLPDMIEGRTRKVVMWRLVYFIDEKNPETFAKQLVKDNEFIFVIRYRTKKVGKPTDYSSLALKGTLDNYRSELVRRWKERGLSKLVSIAESNGVKL